MRRARKRKLDKAVEARRRARKVGLIPATTRVVPDKRKKPEKHKGDLLHEDA
jgi:hypothetical protein